MRKKTPGRIEKTAAHNIYNAIPHLGPGERIHARPDRSYELE
jgi:hypothetical protein